MELMNEFANFDFYSVVLYFINSGLPFILSYLLAISDDLMMPVEIGSFIKDFGPTISTFVLIAVTWKYVTEVRKQSIAMANQVEIMHQNMQQESQLEQRRNEVRALQIKKQLYTKLKGQQDELYPFYTSYLQSKLECERYKIILGQRRPSDPFELQRLRDDYNRHVELSDDRIVQIAEKRSRLIETLSAVQLEFVDEKIDGLISQIMKSTRDDLIEHTEKKIVTFNRIATDALNSLKDKDVDAIEIDNATIPPEV